MRALRTDLALEAIGLHTDNKDDGIKQEKYRRGDFTVIHVTIEDERGEEKTGKKRGEYVTAEIKDVLSADIFSAAELLAEIISAMLKKHITGKDKAVLVAGIGNRNITPDAIGPFAADRTLATKHAVESSKELFCGFSPVAVIAPGVLAQTGLEVSEIIKSIVESGDTSAVIAVDALASSSVSRLGNTFQITDTGIAPGSGVQNRRADISRDTMGVPVVAVGVPTVIDGYVSADKDEAEARMFVTPRDIDEIVKRSTKIISLGINAALQPNLTIHEINELI